MIALGGLARLDEDLLGGGNRLLRLLGLDARRRRRASSINCLPSALAFVRWPGAGLDPRQLGLDLLGVRQALGDLLPPRFEHLQDRLVGEPVQQAQTMPKLTICAPRCGQSTPKVRAISSIWPPLSRRGRNARASMIVTRFVTDRSA